MKIIFLIVFFKIFQFSKYIGNGDNDDYAFKSTAIMTLFLSFDIFSITAYYHCHFSNIYNFVYRITFCGSFLQTR